MIQKRKKSLLGKTLSLIRKNPGPFLYMLLFDFLLAGIIYSLSVATKFFPIQDSLVVFGILFLIFLLIIILVYSFFKYLVLDSLKSVFRKGELNFKDFFSFYKLNLAVFLVPFILIFIGILAFASSNLLQYDLTGMVLVVVLLILLIPVLLFIYTLVNMSHTLFVQAKKEKIVKNALKKSLNIPLYGKIYSYNLFFLIIYLVIWLAANYFLRSSGFSTYLQYYSGYRIFIWILTTVVVYFIVVFNRVNFYLVVNKKT